MTTHTRPRAAAIAVTAVAALALTACSGGAPKDPESGGDNGEQITLTIASFNDFGYTDELLAEYTAKNPNIKIVHNRAATSNEARENYFQKLGKKGLADIEAIEIDWMPEVLKYSDLLAPVSDDIKSRWLDWKTAAATDKDGRVIGYGTDVGPEAVCYRADLLGEAGLPTEPDKVAELLQGDWAQYFKIGAEYSEKTGKAWFDSAGGTYQGMVNQIEEAYENPDTGDLIATSNADVKAAYDQVLAASVKQSAHLGQWSDDWMAGLSNGAFATMLCPGWMLGVIEGNAKDVTDWRIANVFPGGGGNWGGSYLTVPDNGAHVAEAQALADWLTAPEQQIKAFENAGTFPSQNEALSSEALLSSTNAYFGDAKTGEIFSERAKAVTVSPFKGEKYFQVNQALQDALTRVEDGTQDAAASWTQWIAEVDAIK